MKRLPLVLALLLGLSACLAKAAEPTPVYELRVYTVHPGRMPALLARFRDHTRTIFDRHGMTSVGYWLPIDGTEKLYYVLKHPSRSAADAAWKAFGSDPEWKKVQKASEEDGPIVSHVDSTFMEATDYSPAGTVGPGAHIYELRIYPAAEGKLADLDARFREHTIALFNRHGMASVMYWHPTDAERRSGHTLIYILAHPSREAASKNWDAFHADPDWIKAKAESEKNGSLLLPAGPKSIFLKPVDFSALL